MENAKRPLMPAEWEEVVVVMRGCGVLDAEAACRSAREHGVSPNEVRLACEHFQAHPGAWSPALLHSIVSTMRGGEAVTWPKPSAEFQERQRRSASLARQSEWHRKKAEQIRQREERKVERERLRAENEAHPFDMEAEFRAAVRRQANGAETDPH